MLFYVFSSFIYTNVDIVDVVDRKRHFMMCMRRDFKKLKPDDYAFALGNNNLTIGNYMACNNLVV